MSIHALAASDKWKVIKHVDRATISLTLIYKPSSVLYLNRCYAIWVSRPGYHKSKKHSIVFVVHPSSIVEHHNLQPSSHYTPQHSPNHDPYQHPTRSCLRRRTTTQRTLHTLLSIPTPRLFLVRLIRFLRLLRLLWTLLSRFLPLRHPLLHIFRKSPDHVPARPVLANHVPAGSAAGGGGAVFARAADGRGGLPD